MVCATIYWVQLHSDNPRYAQLGPDDTEKMIGNACFWVRLASSPPSAHGALSVPLTDCLRWWCRCWSSSCLT